jgi:hypothetical protein
MPPKTINAEIMAQAMETAFGNVWLSIMAGQPVPAMNPQMHLMFLAIAEGVVNHLKANAEAFQVTVKQTGTNTTYAGNVSVIV